MKIIPPAEITPGRYEIRIRTTSLSDNEPVTGEDKIITVEVQAEANVFGTIIIVLLILAIISGIVFFGMRLSKK